MASPLLPISNQDVTLLVRQVNGNQLLNRQLSSICQINGLKSTGVKLELQRRISESIREAAASNDIVRFNQIRQSIINIFPQRSSPSSKSFVTRAGDSPLTISPFSTNCSPSTSSYNNSSANGGSTQSQRDYHKRTSYAPPIPPLIFPSSPFYQVESRIGSLEICDGRFKLPALCKSCTSNESKKLTRALCPEVMAQHRHTINIPIRLNENGVLQKCLSNGAYRVMIFCAAGYSGLQHIAFPHQSELKVNGGEMKANLRGLKNKPGSTRPVDITSALRMCPNYVNNVELTYALTNKKFYLAAFLCKITDVSELVSTIASHRKIPREAVVGELNKAAQDPEVVATSQVLSLKCPLSCMRLEVPCRSLTCPHIQCFDATSYLQLQEQGPQWLCPICSRLAPYEQLAVDEDILQNTPKDRETVTIEPNGRWSIRSSIDGHSGEVSHSSNTNTELVEICNVNLASERFYGTPKVYRTSVRTPCSDSRNGSASTPGRLLSAKRPAPLVVDLTLESDDDEPIQRPNKRQSTASFVNASTDEVGLSNGDFFGHHT